MSEPVRPAARPARPRLADPRRCPWCEQDPAGPVCRVCGLTLTGEVAARLWYAGTQADHWLDERESLLARLRAVSPTPRPVSTPRHVPPPHPSLMPPVPQPQPPVPQPPVLHPPVPQPPVPPAPGSGQQGRSIHLPTGLPPVPASGPPLRPQPAATSRPAAPAPAPAAGSGRGEATLPTWRRALGVQTVLVGVGALLLAVSAVIFLAFSWDALGLGGRSLVIGGVTAAVLVGAWRARRAGLSATAESVAGLGAVLVLLDAAAVRATGLAGDGIGPLAYSAIAALTCTVLLGGYGLVARLRAATVAAALVLPTAPLLLGAHVAARASDLAAVSAALVLGLAGSSLVVLVTELRPVAGAGLRAERRVLTVASGTAWVAGAVTAPLVVAGDVLTAAAVVAVLAAVALTHALVGAPSSRDGVWATAAGAAAAAALCLLVIDVLPGRWTPLTLPVAVTVLACGLGVLGRSAAPAPATTDAAAPATAQVRTPRFAAVVRWAGAGAGWTLVPVALPALLVAATLLIQPLAATDRAWSAGATEPVATVAGFGTGDASLAVLWCTLLGLVVLSAAAVLVPLARGDRATPWSAGASAALATGAAVVLPWQPGAPLVVAVVAAVLVSAGLGVAAVAVERGAGPAGRIPAPLTRVVVTTALVLASVGLLTAVPAGWANRWTSVPVTVLASGALLLARRRLPAAGPLLLPAAALALMVCAGASGRLAGLTVSDATLLAAAAGALVAVSAVLVPSVRAVERRALLLAGLVPLLGAATVVALLDLAVGADAGAAVIAPRPQLLLLAAVAACLVAAAAPRGRLGRADVMAASGVATALVCALAASVAAQWGPVSVSLAVAAAIAAAAVLAATAARAHDVRHLAVERVAVVAAVVLLLAGVVVGDLSDVWGPSLVLAAAAGVMATAPGHHRYVWVCLGLGTAGLWARQLDDVVSAVEAYSLPPAGALLAATAVTWVRSHRLLTPVAAAGLALAVLPSAVAGVTGPAWRALAVLVVVALMLGAGWVLGARAGSADAPHRITLGRLVAATAVAALLAGPWARSVRLAEGPVETALDLADGWVLATSLLLLAAVPLTRTLLPAGSDALRWALVPALGALTLPLLLAVLTDHATPREPLALQPARVLLVVLAGAALAVAAAARRRPPTDRVAQAAGLSAATIAVLTGLAAGVATSGRPLELLTIPLAVAVLATGVVEMRRTEVGSWPWLGTGSVLLLVPSLLASFVDPDPWRVGLLAVAGAGVLATGATQRWQAPVLVGSTVLVVHAVTNLWPWLTLAYDTVPRWVSLGLAGALLLALGARYEHRVRDLQEARLRLSSMR